jgi:hypothetical protein
LYWIQIRWVFNQLLSTMKGRIVFVRFRANGDAEERKSAVIKFIYYIGFFVYVNCFCLYQKAGSFLIAIYTL